MNRLVEWIKLMWQLPHGQAIFLRPEYDKLGKKLMRLASWNRRVRLKKCRMVAVVGSLGKSSARNAIHTILSCPDRNFSYSNYGASLAHNLLKISKKDPRAVLEAGIHGPGSMKRLADMIRPDVVVVTSIASEHNRSFATLEDTREEKAYMVRSLDESGLAILNWDDPHVMWMASQTRAKVVTYGFSEGCDFQALPIPGMELSASHFYIRTAGSLLEVETRLTGKHVIYSLLGAVAVAAAELPDWENAISRLKEIVPMVSRVEVIQLDDGSLILDDSYKAATESILSALDVFSQIPSARKIVVIGNIDEPVGKQGDLNRMIGEKIEGIADFVIGMGGDNLKGMRAGATKAGMPISSFKLMGSNAENTLKELQFARMAGDAILIKGAHSQRMRRLVLALQGRKVTCDVKYCGVKVSCCDVCPLLDAPPEVFKNGLVQRFLKTRKQTE